LVWAAESGVISFKEILSFSLAAVQPVAWRFHLKSDLAAEAMGFRSEENCNLFARPAVFRNQFQNGIHPP